MKRNSRFVVLSIALLGIADAVGLAAAATPQHALVKAAPNAAIGKPIVVDARGRTLYMYAFDTRGKSSCVDDSSYHCIKAWPAVLTKAKPVAGAGLRRSLVGTTRRPDGRLQVTYGGHPLYYFARDAGGFGIAPDRKAGDAHGQGYAGIWYVVSPTGKPIKSACKTKDCS
jgi:predicted lipoprotein with Yx(FWY)xxD motif